MATTKKKAPAGPKTADQLIRELRAMGERRGWKASSSGVDGDGRITVVFELPKEPPPA